MPETSSLGETRRRVKLRLAIREERRRRQAEHAQARLADAIEAARSGDPFPYIELQWGQIIRVSDIIADPGLIDRLRAAGERFVVLDDFQIDILASVFSLSDRSTWVKGNTGCGKGGAAGLAICTYYGIFGDARVIISRDTAERAVKIVLGEAARWWRRMLIPPPGCMLQTTGIVDISDRTHEVRVANPDSTEGFTGSHAPHVLVVFDEATASVLTPFYPLVPTIAHKFLTLANPRTTGGPFYDAFHESDEPDKTQTLQAPDGTRRLITVDGNDILNVRMGCLKHPVAPPGGCVIEGRSYSPGEPLSKEHAKAREAIIPGQTCADEHAAICANHDVDHVACFGHGRFPQDDKATALFLRRWFHGPHAAWERYDRAWRRATSNERHRKHVPRLRAYWPIRAFGLDVGGSERGDPSILTCGGDRGVWRQFSAQLGDATALADWVIATVREQCHIELTDGGLPIGIDATGIGWGVGGLLRQQGCHVVEIRGNDTTSQPRSYKNLRAEMYGELSKRLDPEGRWGYTVPDGPITRDHFRDIRNMVFALPPDPMLVAELRATEKVYGPDGMRFAATPKRKGPGLKEGVITVQDRIKRSPDKSDSLSYFYHALEAGGISLDEALSMGFF